MCKAMGKMGPIGFFIWHPLIRPPNVVLDYFEFYFSLIFVLFFLTVSFLFFSQVFLIPNCYNTSSPVAAATCAMAPNLQNRTSSKIPGTLV
jgi:hypothetical protein